MTAQEPGLPHESDPLFMLGQAQAVLDRLEGEYRSAVSEQAAGGDDLSTLNDVASRLRSARAAYEELLQICEARAAAEARTAAKAKATEEVRVSVKGRGAAETAEASGLIVEDAEGFDFKPDPLAARTPAELMGTLRRYREWADNPPYRKMAARAGGPVVASTLCTALRGDDLPRLHVVVAIVAGCGGSEEDQQRYATAWRRVRQWPGLRVVPPIAGTG